MAQSRRTAAWDHAAQTPRHRRRAVGLVLLAAAGLSVDAGCSDDSEGVDNPSFRDWCTDRPCDWDLDTGRVSSVTTWHHEDRAVRFEAGTDAQISQVQPSSSARCLQFDLIAFVDDDARLVLRLDFNDDGSVDREQVVSEKEWESVPFSVPTPASYQSLRFILRKQGTGTAQIAQIVVTEAESCPEATSDGASSACDADGSCEPVAEAARQREESE